MEHLIATSKLKKTLNNNNNNNNTSSAVETITNWLKNS